MTVWFVIAFSLNFTSQDVSFTSKKEAQDYAESYQRTCEKRNDICKIAIVERKI